MLNLDNTIRVRYPVKGWLYIDNIRTTEVEVENCVYLQFPPNEDRHNIKIRRFINIQNRKQIRMERRQRRQEMDFLWCENSSSKFLDNVLHLKQLFGLARYEE